MGSKEEKPKKKLNDVRQSVRRRFLKQTPATTVQCSAETKWSFNMVQVGETRKKKTIYFLALLLIQVGVRNSYRV